MRITIPEAFAHDTITREGDAGRQWLSELPSLIESLCHDWQLTIDGAPMHGYVGIVLPVQRRDEACVLKLSWLDESTQDEAKALTAWNGQGAVKLLDTAPAQGALLLERLDAKRSLNDLPIAEALAIAGRLLRQLAIPVTGGFRTQQSLAQKIIRNLPERWERFGRPFPRLILTDALELSSHYAQTIGHRLVNHDLHYHNVLAGERQPWLVIDPKVGIGDPEYGIAQLFINGLEKIETEGGLDLHFQRLVDAAALDAERARAWTFVRTIDSWLWGLSVGLTEGPKRCERIVDWLCGDLISPCSNRNQLQ